MNYSWGLSVYEVFAKLLDSNVKNQLKNCTYQQGVYPFNEYELDEMASGHGVNDFICNLKRKLFTEDYMSTKNSHFFSLFSNSISNIYYWLNSRCYTEKVPICQAPCNRQVDWGLRKALHGKCFQILQFVMMKLMQY